MTHKETCNCARRSLDFASAFDGDTVTRLYCPDCVNQAPPDAVVFELCDDPKRAGIWAVAYNAGELKRLDPGFRDSDDYYLSLLIAGTCGPKAVSMSAKTALCRVLGMKRGPDMALMESTLSGKEAAWLEREDATERATDKPVKPTKRGSTRTKRRKR